MEEKGEGLKITAKGSKDLPGGQRLHVIVAIAHGKRDVLREAYNKMNAAFFCEIIISMRVLHVAGQKEMDKNFLLCIMTQVRQVGQH